MLTPGLRDHSARRSLATAGRASINRYAVQERPSHFVLDHLDPNTDHAIRNWPDAPPAAEQPSFSKAGTSPGIQNLRFERRRDGTLVRARQTAPFVFWADVPYLDPSCGDPIIWELNRHQHWLVLGRAFWLTGDHRYRNAMIGQLESWLRTNPPRTGINWASMLELGFRSLSWTWALHFLAADHGESVESPWLVDLLIGLDAQLTHVEHNLSHYFSPNTHLTGEALSLYVVGHALPELAASPRWIERGREILLREIDRQIGRTARTQRVDALPPLHARHLSFALLTAIRATSDTKALRIFQRRHKLAVFMRPCRRSWRLPAPGRR